VLVTEAASEESCDIQKTCGYKVNICNILTIVKRSPVWIAVTALPDAKCLNEWGNN
jgi:hypothetical protein